MKAKPAVGIQFGVGGTSAAEELEAEGTRDPKWAIIQAKRLEASAYLSWWSQRALMMTGFSAECSSYGTLYENRATFGLTRPSKSLTETP